MLINSQCDFLGLEQASYPALHTYGWGHGAIAILNTFASNLHATANRIHRANTPLFFHRTPHTIIFLSLMWISLELETERTWNGSHISCRRIAFPRPLLCGSHGNVGLKTLNHENVLNNEVRMFLWQSPHRHGVRNVVQTTPKPFPQVAHNSVQTTTAQFQESNRCEFCSKAARELCQRLVEKQNCQRGSALVRCVFSYSHCVCLYDFDI